VKLVHTSFLCQINAVIRKFGLRFGRQLYPFCLGQVSLRLGITDAESTSPSKYWLLARLSARLLIRLPSPKRLQHCHGALATRLRSSTSDHVPYVNLVYRQNNLPLRSSGNAMYPTPCGVSLSLTMLIYDHNKVHKVLCHVGTTDYRDCACSNKPQLFSLRNMTEKPVCHRLLLALIRLAAPAATLRLRRRRGCAARLPNRLLASALQSSPSSKVDNSRQPFPPSRSLPPIRPAS